MIVNQRCSGETAITFRVDPPNRNSPTQASYTAALASVKSRPRGAQLCFSPLGVRRGVPYWDSHAVSYYSATANPTGDRPNAFCLGQNILAQHDPYFRADVSSPERLRERARERAKHNDSCCVVS